MFKPTNFVGHGYKEVHCIKTIFLCFKTPSAWSISFQELMPVDKKIFKFLFLFNSCSKGKLFTSPEGILIFVTPNLINLYNAALLNMEHKKFILFFLQYLIIFTHSLLVNWILEKYSYLFSLLKYDGFGACSKVSSSAMCN